MPASATGIEVGKALDGGAVVSLTGVLDVRSAGAARRDLLAKLAGIRPDPLSVDAAGLYSADVSGMVVLWEQANGLVVPGVRATISGLRPELEAILAAYPSPDEVEAAVSSPAESAGIHSLGAGAVSLVADLRSMVEFVGAVTSALLAGLRHPRAMRWPEVLRIVEKAGVNAFAPWGGTRRAAGQGATGRDGDLGRSERLRGDVHRVGLLPPRGARRTAGGGGGDQPVRYDPLLLGACHFAWRPASMVVGAAMGACDAANSLSDLFFGSSLRTLVDAGRIEADGPRNVLRGYRVRLVGG